MARYKNFILTNQGIGLLAELMNGNGELEFRYLAVGSGTYSVEDTTLDKIREMEKLKEERQRVAFSYIGRAEDGFVLLKANVTNEGLTEGYQMTEAGIYAGKKGQEGDYLYCVSMVGNPDYMPSYQSKLVYNVIYKMAINIGDAANATIVYKTDIYALAEDLRQEEDRAQEAENQLQERIEEETSRAELAEDELQAQIQEEKVRAELAEGTLQEGIDTESVRAGEEEAKLRQSKLDKDGDASETVVGFAEASELSPLSSGSKLSVLMGMIARGVSSLISHIAHKGNPHDVTKSQVGLGKADNTSDTDKPVSTAQRAAIDASYQQATGYTNQKIADLIGGAPTTLDTLGEIADAMAENADVVAALNVAIGKKANEAEFNSHVKNTTAHITASERNYWNGKAEGNHTHNYSVPGHTHDDRYYTESEMNTKLSEKADSGHTHNYAAASHSHDDRYYTESEMNTKLSEKADSGHTHNYAAASHSHDDRYYTESEMNTKLAGKADSGHTHSYLPLSGGKLTGNLNIGDKVWLDANNEGGNVKIAAPDGTQWEIDAYDGSLRIFTYANGVKIGVTIDKNGRVYLPNRLTSPGFFDGFSVIPYGDGIGWTDWYYKAGTNLINMLSIFVNQKSSFVRSNNGDLFLEAKKGSNGVGCMWSDTTEHCPIYAASFTVNSSRRYKTNIAPIPDDRARKMLDVEIVTYDYIEGIVSEESRYNRVGVEAEKVGRVLPDVVTYKEVDGEVVPDGVDYSRFVPYLIRLAQTQQAEIDRMKSKIHELTEVVEKLKGKEG